MIGFQQTRISSARQLTRRTVFASARLGCGEHGRRSLQNVLAAERTDCIVIERSARVLSLLQAANCFCCRRFECQVSTKLPRLQGTPALDGDHLSPARPRQVGATRGGGEAGMAC